MCQGRLKHRNVELFSRVGLPRDLLERGSIRQQGLCRQYASDRVIDWLFIVHNIRWVLTLHWLNLNYDLPIRTMRLWPTFAGN